MMDGCAVGTTRQSLDSTAGRKRFGGIMEERWTVLTNGSKYRVRCRDTGEYVTRLQTLPLGVVSQVPMEWDDLDEALAAAASRTWLEV